MCLVQRDDCASVGGRFMKGTLLASKIPSKESMSHSVGQPVQISFGTPAGIPGVLKRLSASGRALIKLERGVYLDVDQDCVEPVKAVGCFVERQHKAAK